MSLNASIRQLPAGISEQEVYDRSIDKDIDIDIDIANIYIYDHTDAAALCQPKHSTRTGNSQIWIHPNLRMSSRQGQEWLWSQSPYVPAAAALYIGHAGRSQGWFWQSFSGFALIVKLALIIIDSFIWYIRWLYIDSSYAACLGQSVLPSLRTPPATVCQRPIIRENSFTNRFYASTYLVSTKSMLFHQTVCGFSSSCSMSSWRTKAVLRDTRHISRSKPLTRSVSMTPIIWL